MNKIGRREFVKNAYGATISITIGQTVISLLGLSVASTLESCNKAKIFTKLHPATDKSFPLLEVSGSYYDIGYAIGNNFGKEIGLVFKRRKKWFSQLKEFVLKDNDNLFDNLLSKAEESYPHFVDELRGMSKGANIPFEDIFLMNIKSEIGAKMVEDRVETPGCSTIHLVDEKRKYIFHNEDGNEAFRDIMFMVKVNPPSGVAFYALTYPGTIIGNGPGINSFGIAQTTNYIASMKWNIGIPRYILNRAVLEAKSLEEAINIATNPNRAFAYHHNLGSVSEKRIISLEVTPDIHNMKETKGIYYHTNHLILDKTKDLAQDEEYVNSSSSSRYSVLTEKIENFQDVSEVTIEDCMNILSSHEKAPYSPCRHPEGDVMGRTLATGVIDLNGGSLKIFKGNPCMAFKNKLVTEYSVQEL